MEVEEVDDVAVDQTQEADARPREEVGVGGAGPAQAEEGDAAGAHAALPLRAPDELLVRIFIARPLHPATSSHGGGGLGSASPTATSA